jgi:hypothetical protein
VRSEFDGFRVEFESFDPTTRVVHVRSAAGAFSATWRGDSDPKPGDWSGVEFSTDGVDVWGVSVTDALPGEPDSIAETDEGWFFVGTVLGHDPGDRYYSDGGRSIPENDLEDGIFFLRIVDSILMFVADGLPADAAGKRVRVHQTTVGLFPQ